MMLHDSVMQMQSAVALVAPKKDVNEMGNLKASERSGIRPPTLVRQKNLRSRVGVLLDNRT